MDHRYELFARCEQSFQEVKWSIDTLIRSVDRLTERFDAQYRTGTFSLVVWSAPQSFVSYSHCHQQRSRTLIVSGASMQHLRVEGHSKGSVGSACTRTIRRMTPSRSPAIHGWCCTLKINRSLLRLRRNRNLRDRGCIR